MSVFIVAAKRTPFGAFGGKLKSFSATQLGTHVSQAVLATSNISPNLIDSVVFGNVQQTSSDAAYITRHIGLKSGIPVHVPALTVNRLCGSGFESVVYGAQQILLGEAKFVLAGGTESMSQAPFALRDARWGTKLGIDLKLEDTLWAGLNDTHAKAPMAMTAENLAEKYGITRQQADEFALLSQKRWAEAHDSGRFQQELAPVPIKTKKGVENFEVDEHPRPDTTLEILSKLPTVFKENGTVTAGNASGIADGAGALILASEKAIQEHKLTPLARLVSWASVGVEPTMMGIGPVEAIKLALKRGNLTLNDIDLVEVNEAFASQFLAVEKELGLDRSKSNLSGGSVALGHPLGASGARITAHCCHELQRRKWKYAIASACIGGGQGIALILERV